MRTLIDYAGRTSRRATARAVREAVRLERTTLPAIADGVGQHPRRRGSRAVGEAVARYSGLPLERARSGSEVHAIEHLGDAGLLLPRLNRMVAGLEADLSWPSLSLIIEIDGEPWHRDVGADADRDARWRAAGWTVRRIPAGDVDAGPERLVALACAENVPLATS